MLYFIYLVFRPTGLLDASERGTSFLDDDVVMFIGRLETWTMSTCDRTAEMMLRDKTRRVGRRRHTGQAQNQAIEREK